MKKPSNQILVNALVSRINLEHKIPSMPLFANESHKKIAQDAIASVVCEVQDFIAQAIGEEEAKNFASRCVGNGEKARTNPDGNSRHHLTSEA